MSSDGTFTGTESETSSTVSGTYTTTSTGFIKATVSSKTGSHAPAVGTVLSGVEVTGFALLWAPILDTETQIVGTIVTGTCPTTTFTSNYLKVQFANAINLTDTGTSQPEVFGVATWNNTTKVLVVDHKNIIANSYQNYTGGNSQIDGSTCANGVTTNASFNAYWTTGAALIHVVEAGSPDLGNSIVAMPQASVTLAEMVGNYAGFVYDDSATPKVRPITGVLSGTSSGSLVVTGVDTTDLVTAVSSVSGTMSLTAFNAPYDGFIKGTVGSAPAICMGKSNVLGSGKNALFCLGQNPSNNSKPYLLVLATK